MTTTTGILVNELHTIAASRSDRAAFATIYEHYFAAVYNYVYYRVPTAVQAEDLTALIFERALTRLDQFDPAKATFAPWLFRIARNAVTDHLRSQQRRQWFSLELLGSWRSSSPDPESQALADETQAMLVQAMTQLSDRERDLLALKFVTQMTNRHIAEITNLDERNVAVILFRALRRLRTLIDASGFEK